MSTLTISVVVNDKAKDGREQEHGLALALFGPNWNYFYDTGAGKTLVHNLQLAQLMEQKWDGLFLSHGHYDHTGGLAPFLKCYPGTVVYYGTGLAVERFSCQKDRPAEDISIPESAYLALKSIPGSQRIPVNSWTCLNTGLILTGPIPRRTFEDCGGPFFLDELATIPDQFSDESALIIPTSNGNILITGCCHSGLINTLEYCRLRKYPIRTVVGGLHLKNASENRLTQTADYLNRSSVHRLFLLHCTGGAAIEYLSQYCIASVFELCAGDVLDIDR